MSWYLIIPFDVKECEKCGAYNLVVDDICTECGAKQYLVDGCKKGMLGEEEPEECEKEKQRRLIESPLLPESP